MVNNILCKQIRPSVVTPELIAQLTAAFPQSETNPAWDLESLQHFTGSENNILLLAQVEGELAAFVFGNVLDRPDKQKQFLIYELSTTAKYRRQGVMRKLLEYLFSILRERNFTEAWVLTNKNNLPAESLYQACGGMPEHDDDQMFVFNLHTN
jgi:ribosomal protein S18 acetylase RimI-like enzyme